MKLNKSDKIEERAISIVNKIFSENNIYALLNTKDKEANIDGYFFANESVQINVQIKGTEKKYSSTVGFKIESKYFEYAKNNFLCFIVVYDVFGSNPVIKYENIISDNINLPSMQKSKTHRFKKEIDTKNIGNFINSTLTDRHKHVQNNIYLSSETEIETLNKIITESNTINFSVKVNPDIFSDKFRLSKETHINEKGEISTIIWDDKKSTILLSNNKRIRNIRIGDEQHKISILYDVSKNVKCELYDMKLTFIKSKDRVDITFNNNIINMKYIDLYINFLKQILHVDNNVEEVETVKSLVGFKEVFESFLSRFTSSKVSISLLTCLSNPKKNILTNYIENENFLIIVQVDEYKILLLNSYLTTSDHLLTYKYGLLVCRTTCTLKKSNKTEIILGNELLYIGTSNKAYNLIDCINIDFEKILLTQFEELLSTLNQYCEGETILNKIILFYIEYYKQFKSQLILNFLLDTEYLNNDDIVSRINKLQLIKYSDVMFTIEEKKELEEYCTYNDNVVPFCANVILGRIDEANDNYILLTPEEKSALYSTPIFKTFEQRRINEEN